MKNPTPIASDLKALVSIARTRRTKVFAYGFLFAFVACTAFLAFNPSNNTSSPWFSNLFSSSSTNSLKASIAPYRSQVSSLISHLFPNSTSSSPPSINTTVPVPNLVNGGGSSKDPILGSGSGGIGAVEKNRTRVGVRSDSPKNGVADKSQVRNVDGGKKDGGAEVMKDKSGSGVTGEKQVGSGSKGSGVTDVKQVKNGSGSGKNAVEIKKGGGSGVTEEKQFKNGSGSDKIAAEVKKGEGLEVKNKTVSGSGSKGNGVTEEKQVKNGAESKEDGNSKVEKMKESGVSNKNQNSTNESSLKGTGVSAKSQKDSKASSSSSSTQKGQKEVEGGGGAKVSNLTSSLSKANGSAKASSNGNGKKKEKWIEDMIGCDIFHGHWVKDDSYPLYPEGSCPHIDEPFDCYLNGRPDRSYQNLRWQPSGCNIPRYDLVYCCLYQFD